MTAQLPPLRPTRPLVTCVIARLLVLLLTGIHVHIIDHQLSTIFQLHLHTAEALVAEVIVGMVQPSVCIVPGHCVLTQALMPPQPKLTQSIGVELQSVEMEPGQTARTEALPLAMLVGFT